MIFKDTLDVPAFEAPLHRGHSRTPHDRAYYGLRSQEERQAAMEAAGGAARRAHEQLASLYRTLSASKAIADREALLDQALSDSFPASDPPAIVAPGADQFPR